MSWNASIRQVHRWVSVVFTLAVIANFAVMGREESTRQLVGLLTVIPLVFLLISGLYLFVLPHAVRWRSARSNEGQVT